MLKKVLDWFFGKNEQPAEPAAPYKVEAPLIVPTADAPFPIVETPAPVVEIAPVTVKAKYKKADLNKMTKKELVELAAKHSVEVKARATKEELVKVLAKV
jgi:hypothetical protein